MWDQNKSPHPSGKSNRASHISLNFSVLQKPHPPGNPNPFCGGSMNIFWTCTIREHSPFIHSWIEHSVLLLLSLDCVTNKSSLAINSRGVMFNWLHFTAFIYCYSQPTDRKPLNCFTYHEINSLYNRTSYFIKLHMSHSKSIHKEHQEQDVWYKKKDVKNPDCTVYKK